MSTTAAPTGLPAERAVMEQAGAENFPVASRLLPRAIRHHLLALYGFARLVDDTGDEAHGDRLAMLDWLDEDLERAYAGEARHPLLRRLSPTLYACGIPAELPRGLIEAGRRDQTVRSYATFDELLGYCELSANPVGRMVLHVLGEATSERLELSDRVCSGLQVTEHLQDVREDRACGRTYLPAEDMERFGCKPADLDRAPASPAVRALIAHEVGRARRLLDEGAPLAATLRGRPRLAVAAFAAGGRSALAAIEAAGHDVLSGSPRAGRVRRAADLLRALAKGGRA
ncbi:MAG: squalene synthase HpnC [Thermoleophilaceae bacterium]